jgi:competence protein ComEA
LKEWIKEYKYYCLGIFLLLLVIVGYYYFSPVPTNSLPSQDLSQVQISEEKNEQEKTPTKEPSKKIMIDIKGAILKPGVYEASEGERVIDLIQRAGGLAETADQTQVNLAMYVTDEMVLYIPSVGENVVDNQSVAVAGGKTESDKVNINSADETQLETLPGIGPSKSAAIIEYRTTNGPFKAIEDIQSISGIGEKTFEKLKDKITVN